MFTNEPNVNENHQHRLFRFSLRTLFIIVSILALWLGWNVHQLRKREMVEQFIVQNINPAALEAGSPVRPWKSLPVMWQLLGAKPIRHIHVQGAHISNDDRADIMASFPEADIVY